LQGLGIDRDVFDAKFFSFKADMVFGPKPLDDLYAFNETKKSFRLGQIESVELIVAISQAKGEKRFSIIHDIEACQLARYGYRMAQAEQHHRGTDGASTRACSIRVGINSAPGFSIET
jgi:hypothetical protein